MPVDFLTFFLMLCFHRAFALKNKVVLHCFYPNASSTCLVLRNVGQLFYQVAYKLQQTGCMCQKHPALLADVEKGLSMLVCLTETFGGRGGKKEPLARKAPEHWLSHPRPETPGTSNTWEEPWCQSWNVIVLKSIQHVGCIGEQAGKSISSQKHVLIKMMLNIHVVLSHAYWRNWMFVSHFWVAIAKKQMLHCYFLSLAPSPLARLKQVFWYPWNSRAAELLPLFTQYHSE